MVESSSLAVDASEVDLSAADNASIATSGADESWLASSVNVDHSCRLQVPTPATAVAERGRSTDVDDSTDDEHGASRLLGVVLITLRSSETAVQCIVIGPVCLQCCQVTK